MYILTMRFQTLVTDWAYRLKKNVTVIHVTCLVHLYYAGEEDEDEKEFLERIEEAFSRMTKLKGSLRTPRLLVLQATAKARYCIDYFIERKKNFLPRLVSVNQLLQLMLMLITHPPTIQSQ